MLFAAWWMAEKTLQPLDEVLLTVLQIQPSEIDALDMDDYWGWIEVAEREIKRRNEMMRSLYGR